MIIIQPAQKPPRKLGGFSHRGRKGRKGRKKSKKVLTILGWSGNINKLSERQHDKMVVKGARESKRKYHDEKS